jgi:hypothetical protein
MASKRFGSPNRPVRSAVIVVAWQSAFELVPIRLRAVIPAQAGNQS